MTESSKSLAQSTAAKQSRPTAVPSPDEPEGRPSTSVIDDSAQDLQMWRGDGMPGWQEEIPSLETYENSVMVGDILTAKAGLKDIFGAAVPFLKSGQENTAFRWPVQTRHLPLSPEDPSYVEPFDAPENDFDPRSKLQVTVDRVLVLPREERHLDKNGSLRILPKEMAQAISWDVTTNYHSEQTDSLNGTKVIDQINKSFIIHATSLVADTSMEEDQWKKNLSLYADIQGNSEKGVPPLNWTKNDDETMMSAFMYKRPGDLQTATEEQAFNHELDEETRNYGLKVPELELNWSLSWDAYEGKRQSLERMYGADSQEEYGLSDYEAFLQKSK